MTTAIPDDVLRFQWGTRADTRAEWNDYFDLFDAVDVIYKYTAQS